VRPASALKGGHDHAAAIVSDVRVDDALITLATSARELRPRDDAARRDALHAIALHAPFGTFSHETTRGS